MPAALEQETEPEEPPRSDTLESVPDDGQSATGDELDEHTLLTHTSTVRPNKFGRAQPILKLNEHTATTEGYTPGVVYTERYADSSVYVGTFGRNGREGDGQVTYANG